MAKVPDSNSKYLSKGVICRDVAEILSSPTLHFRTKYAVLKNVAWAWSEFQGKYDGCPYWSEAALACERTKRKLIHEHAVPKSVLIKMLFEIKNPTPKSVEDILSRYCVAVVVTKDEDRLLSKAGLRSKMPADWDGSDLWARYRKVGIVPRKVAEVRS